jgi:hypothetical protein
MLHKQPTGASRKEGNKMSEQDRSNLVTIHGLIKGSRKYNDSYFYDVVLPAQDEYTQPMSISVESTKNIGKPGDVLNALCTINSYFRKFVTKDGEEGRSYNTRFVVVA